MRVFQGLLAMAAAAWLAATASAHVWHHDWVYYNDSGGSGELYDEVMYITGGNANVPGWTAFTTTVHTLTHFEFYVNYSTDDSEDYDWFYVAVNGNQVGAIYNYQEGDNHFFAYVLNPGDKITLGVYTVDGIAGPGFAVVHALRAWSLLGMDQFDWYPFSANGSGSVDLPPPYLDVVGGDAGFEDWTDGYIFPQVAVYAYAAGSYSSVDELDYDQGYYYTSADGYVPFINNGTQGDFGPFFVYAPASSTLAYGVHTNDGLVGPGNLHLAYLTGYMFPGILNEFFWSTVDTAGGSVFYGDGVINVTGGDVGVPGYTEFVVDAGFAYHVESDFYYESADELEYDSAYYTINGNRYWIADNAHQGYWYVDFVVNKGDTFGFGVTTTDGDFGPGILSIYRTRTWALPSASCYADCDGNGTLDLFDFLCFQNAFVAHDEYADCEDNGAFNLFDFLCYQNAFVGGC